MAYGLPDGLQRHLVKTIQKGTMGDEMNRYVQDDFCGFIFNKPQLVKESLRGWVDHFRNIGHRFVMLQHRLTGNYVIFKEGQDVRHLEQPIPLSEVLNDGYRMVEYLDRADETCKRENTLQSGI